MTVRKCELKSVCFILVLMLTSSMSYSQVKLAQSGFQFLSIGTDARAAGMAEAMTTIDWGSGALFFNPAGMANMSARFDLAASRNYWIADINHDAFSIALNPANGVFGVFGVTVHSVNYGEVQGTMVVGTDYVDTEVFTPLAMAFGVGYAKALSDRFAVGGHIRTVGQYLGKNVIEVDSTRYTAKNVAFATAFDFGTLFKTGYKGLIFGMSLRNFSNEIKFEKEGFQLPLTFRLGISMNLFNLLATVPENQALNLYVDATHPRAYYEQLNVGVEYSLWNRFFLRGGYMFSQDDSEEYGAAFGFGLRSLGFSIDYAYTPFGIFDKVQRFTVRFSS